jgi:putative ABC transport system permease protein
MSWINAAREHIRNLFLTRDAELDEEIAHHLDVETRRQIRAGVDPRTARRRANERFGNRQRVADATRDARGPRLLEGLGQDVQWATRSLTKNPGFTALALFTLTLGVGATTTAFAVLDTVILRDLPYRNPGRLVFMQELNAKHDTRPASYPNFADWRARTRSFDGVASAQFPEVTTVRAASDAEPQRVTMMGVSRNFFAVLGAPVTAGREFTPDEQRGDDITTAMVSYEFWQRELGGRMPLGDLLVGDARRAIVGVTPPNFKFVTAADIYFPYEPWAGTIRSAHNYMVVGRLKPDVPVETARAELATLSRALLATYGNETEAVDVDVQPLQQYLVGNYRTLLMVVFAAALCVLLIACTNLLSAQLARGWSREREIAVRTALGASRRRLLRQLCVESMVLVFSGAVLGTLLALGLTYGVRTVGAGLLPRLGELTVDTRVLGFVIAVLVVTTLVVGLYPAVRLSGTGGGAVLRGSRGSAGTIRTSLWRTLVGFEVALAVVLLVGAALLVRTMHNILTADTGIDPHGLVTASVGLGQDEISRVDEFVHALAAVPGVEGAAFANRLPFSWGNTSGPVRRPADPLTHDYPALAGFRLITPEYFSVVRQPVLSGRAFTSADRAGAEKVAIITSGLASKLWPGESAIGKRVATNYLFDQWLTVVGVVPEAASWSMARGEQHEIFVPLAQQLKAAKGSPLVAVVRVGPSPSAMVQPLRAKLRELLPQSAAQMSTIDERIARSAADKRFAMLALTAFGTIALLLAAIGIYGVVWYVVTTRTREIGIRMALGATAASVQRHILSGAFAMAGVGVVVGVLGGAFATKFLQASLYGVSRLDVATYSAGALVTLLIAIVGAYIPARRSSRVDPMIAMRSEA